MLARKRLILEIAAALLLILLCRAVWSPARPRSEGLEELRSRHESAIGEMRLECDKRADKLAASEAEAVLRAFAAGIQGEVLTGGKESLNAAKSRLLRMPNVVFVHLLSADGTLLTSSSEIYTVSGTPQTRVSSWALRSRWALQATSIRTRPGDLPGTTELAAPLQAPPGKKVFLWLGYRTGELLEGSREKPEM